MPRVRDRSLRVPYRRSTSALVLASSLAGLLSGADGAIAQSAPVLDRGDAVVSGFPGIRPPLQPVAPGANPLDHFMIDPEGPAAQILSMRTLAGAPTGQLVHPAAKLKIKAGQVGMVFAIALDDGRGQAAPAVYLGASAAYGLHIVDPNGTGPGRPKRLKTGKPGARWMEGMFGLEAGGGPGSIWRVDGTTGQISLFANLPVNSGPGIGDIVVDAKSGQVFVSDLDNGLIYRLAANGTVVDSFDHGLSGRPAKGLAPVIDDGKRANIEDATFDTTNPNTWGFTQIERRVGGMSIHGGRLYYAVHGGHQIWSVGLTDAGAFAGDARWELDVTGLAGPGPITDMLFDGEGHMLLAQRGAQKGSYDFSVYAEPQKSDVMRFRRESPDDPATPSLWVAERESYAIGTTPDHRFADGGIALGYRHDGQGALRAGTCGSTLWSTGSRLRTSSDPAAGVPSSIDVHGLQGNDAQLTRPQNVPPVQSYFADYDAMFGDAEKAGHVGDVEIWQPCGGPDFAVPQGQGFELLPPGFVPPTDTLPPSFPDPEPGYRTNLELRKVPVGDCLPWGGGWICQYAIRVRNTGPDFYWAPIVLRDELPLAPAGAMMGFAAAPWACWNAGPASYGCWRPNTFLAPGASVWLTAYAWVPNSYPHCHLQNNAEITWAPGGSPSNTELLDDFDSAVSAIPAPQCPPPGGPTNLVLEKTADPEQCAKDGSDFICRFRVDVINAGPGVYTGNLVVRDEPAVGTTVAIGGPGWACAPAGAGHDCTRNLIGLNPAQIVKLTAFVKVSQAEALANGCKVENAARILVAPGGTPKNTNPADDDDVAEAEIDDPICQPPVAPAKQECPAGFVLKDGSCEKRQSGSTPMPPVAIPPRRDIKPDPKPDPRPDRNPDPGPDPDRVRSCPDGMIGKYPNCSKPERPRVCPQGTTGNFPNCRRIEIPRFCPSGTIGKWPDCKKPDTPKVCPPGTVGAYPNCKPRSPSGPSGQPTKPRVCPKGTIGTPPNCRPLSLKPIKAAPPQRSTANMPKNSNAR